MISRYTLPSSASNELQFGAETTTMKKTERRVQTETLQGGSAQGVDLDESFVTEVSRAAIYLRDEWRPSQQVSAHLGARAEYLTLKADYTPSELVRSFPQFAPSAQLAWRPLAQHSFRFGVGRTFKIPGTRELSPRRFIVTDNTPSNPDTRGNRYLEPESALGIDIAYEQTAAASTSSMTISARKISNVTLQTLGLEEGRYVLAPLNRGKAKVLSVDLGHANQLQGIVSKDQSLQVKIALSRNWSLVDSIPGPDNRLADQIPLSATLGLELRANSGGSNAGINYVYQGRRKSKLLDNRTFEAGEVQSLDLYLRRRLGRNASARLALTNALAPVRVSTLTYAGVEQQTQSRTRNKTAPTIRFQFEASL
ncbi:MAG: TonB-dependent receptor domain-containing protein [Pseudomonadota bacterium]